MKLFGKIIWTLVRLCLLGAVILGFVLYIGVVRWESPKVAEVDIKTGSSVRAISSQLAKNAVIRNPRLFEIIARVRGLSDDFKAGAYEFPAGTTMLAVMDKVVSGEVKASPFTVIEGWTIKDIAEALKDKPFLVNAQVPDDFVRFTTDKMLIEELGFGGIASLEGYLFPDTYLVGNALSAEGLIRQMVKRFREVWKEIDGEAEVTLGMTQPQVVTFASIVEKETGAAAERTIVSSVFFNSLKIGMALQSDPTVIYGLPNFDGNIRKRDLSNPHPYNTYVRPGLPPGPICNPGKAALEAVLHPIESKYLYFVSKNNGTHLFTENLSDHLKAVRKYQIEGEGRK